MDPQITFITSLQSHAAIIDPLMQFFAFIGQPEFSLLLIPLIVWCLDRQLGIRILLLVSLSGAICDIIKIAFHTPRPYWVTTEVKALGNYPSFGFPSGHAQNAVLLFGLIATWMKKAWISVVCVIFILLIGLSRVYQAVHYPLDIAGGFAVGLLLLLLYIKFEKPVGKFVKNQSIPMQITLSCMGSLILICLSFMALLSLGSWQVPLSWSTLAFQQSSIPIDPLIPHDTLTGAGLFFGSAVGAILASRYIPTTQKTSISVRILNYVIGMIILLGIWYSLKGYTQIEGIGYGVEYLRSILAGIWITGGAPIIFQKYVHCFR